MFPSFQSLKEHEEFCQQGKKYDCQFCSRKYKRVKNMKAHIKHMHLESGGKMLCSYCGRSYETLTSYKAHYTNNLCIKVIVPGMIEDVDDPQLTLRKTRMNLLRRRKKMMKVARSQSSFQDKCAQTFSTVFHTVFQRRGQYSVHYSVERT